MSAINKTHITLMMMTNIIRFGPFTRVYTATEVSFVPSCAQGTVLDSATVVMFVPTIIVASVSDTIIEYHQHTKP